MQELTTQTEVARTAESPLVMPHDPRATGESEVEALEVDLLLEAIHRRWGYDFRGYATRWMRRRIVREARDLGMGSVSELQAKVLHNEEVWHRLLMRLTVNVTAMFRNPGFYRGLRRHVIPLLREQPFVRIWHVGCATGEEVYSTAILLREEGIYDRCRIYATDIDDEVLERARQGIYPTEVLERYIANYAAAGGRRRLEEYWRSGYDHVRMRRDLRRNVVFARHDLVDDPPFNAFDVIFCRNVMIYFGHELQRRARGLLHRSLAVGSVLGLGRRETLAGTELADLYDTLDDEQRLYRRTA